VALSVRDCFRNNSLGVRRREMREDAASNRGRRGRLPRALAEGVRLGCIVRVAFSRRVRVLLLAKSSVGYLMSPAIMDR
jgi:hypothetical protein